MSTFIRKLASFEKKFAWWRTMHVEQLEIF